MSYLESLRRDLDAVRRAIERLRACPEDERLRRVVATIQLASGVYNGIETVYSASTLAVTKPRPEVPENASAEWYYRESEAMLEALRGQSNEENYYQ